MNENAFRWKKLNRNPQIYLHHKIMNYSVSKRFFV